jgi:hypothetical protein
MVKQENSVASIYGCMWWEEEGPSGIVTQTWECFMSVAKENLCGLNRNMFSDISVVPLTVLFRKYDITEREPHCTDTHF